MSIAGGLRGVPVDLAPCETIDVPYIADAEIVLEAEILPTGWTWPEGRFGEFTRLMGGLHWNPLVRIKAISMRKDAIYYNLHMPWENTWLAAPTRYAAIRQALRTAGVQVKDINVTLGGCAFWHAVISIKKSPGEGKNALLAALSVMDLKHVVVVDDDIDIFDPMDVEWAIATRVQGDKDIMIVGNARAKPLDPSLPQGFGVVPTGAKVGIDATIPEGIPKEHYERITYAYADRAKIADYVKGKADARRQRRRRGGGGEARRRDSRRDRQGAALLHRRRRTLRELRLPHRRPGARASPCDRKAVAGLARPHVRARLAICGETAGEVRDGEQPRPMTTHEHKRGFVGQPIRRFEDPALVTGRGRFSGDLAAAHWVRFVRSPVASGRIVSITAPPGARVITAADVGELPPITPMLHKFNYVPIAQPILAKDVVRFVGEPIAAVVAPSREAAEDCGRRGRGRDRRNDACRRCDGGPR